MQNNQAIVTPFNNPLIRFIVERKYSWIRHTLFITVGFVLAFKGDVDMLDRMNASGKVRQSIYLMDFLMFISIMSILYFVILVLIPHFLFRSKLVLFFLSCVILFFLIYVISYLLELFFLRPFIPYSDVYQYTDFSVVDIIQKSLVVAVMMGCMIGLKVFKKWIIDVQRMNELQQANLKTELEQLKSQINPHFLFNTLNNLHVLTKTDPEKASQVILGLSDLLRYQLYDSAREKIQLSKDITFIHNLLTMEKLRKDDFTYEVNTEGKIDGISVPPFLFIPFVENAIKHGASTVGHSYLTLHFRITEHQLHFTSENSKPPVKTNGIGGLGLKNIKRRLELLYPGNHTLEITDKKDKYIVNLIIPV
ncbi:sensor histidine kinase [Terrimonas pollutisoli]|uniref:sensor histidine kinase n=1 Tax=Terrimonas pollutisoli TaxID=3034147 RepID=UPI0023EA9D36|nr:histidine kinase [Terrimonas sp. H1YJ31]